MRIDAPHAQQRLDVVPLLSVPLNPRSRDEKVKLIRGLQGVYADAAIRQEVLDLIAQDVVRGVRRDVGRPGMDLSISPIAEVISSALAATPTSPPCVVIA